VLLETDDIDVPPPPDTVGGPPLYFRVLSSGPTSLRVELWELGAPRGARSISSAGSDTLRARRIALAAGELARQLRRRRLAEIEAASRAPSGDRTPQAPEHGIPIYARFGLDVGGRIAALGPSDAWVAGPALGVGLGFTSGFRLSLGAAWLVGNAPDLGGGARWLDVSLGASQRLALGAGVAFSVGAEAAAASVRLEDGFEMGASPPLDTWSARAGVVPRLDLSLGKIAKISFGPDLGAVLRPMRATGQDGQSHRIGGLWLGGTIALQLEPR
jgi:hypothetical protein